MNETTEPNLSGAGAVSHGEAPDKAAPKQLSAAALRALAEAAERRAATDARASEAAKEREINGRGGLEPVRYNDWEVKGLATDF